MKLYSKSSAAYVNRSLRIFKPILKSWIRVQRAYEREMEYDDQAWRYHERPCVGFLSAAVWQCGGVTLEEWRTDKRNKKRPRKGRCDLYACRHGREFFIESKHMRSTIRPDHQLKNIRKKLASAVAAASELNCSRSKRLGVLFVIPRYLSSKGLPSDQNHIANWLRAIDTTVRPSAMAWLFHSNQKCRGERNEYVSPGVVLLIQSPKKPTTPRFRK